ncbi:MAG: hypothetical protein SF162_15360 [bacterium]|nr:hypothetical protein [bacterium]
MHRTIVRLSLAILVIVFVFPAASFAQEEAVFLQYGEVYAGVLNDTRFEQTFTFEGEAGQVVVVDTRPNGVNSTIVSTDLILDGPNGRVGVKTPVDFLPGSNNLLAVQLPDDGTYSLFIARDGGRSGSDEGEFALELTLAEPLTETAIEGELSIETIDNYYFVTGLPRFQVQFDQTDTLAAYSANVVVSRLNGDGSFSNVAVIEGREAFRGGSVIVNGGETEVYLVAVTTDTPNDYLTQTIDVEYTLGLGDLDALPGS